MTKLADQWKSIAQDVVEKASKVQCSPFDYVIGLEYIISVLRGSKVESLLRMVETVKKGGVK